MDRYFAVLFLREGNADATPFPPIASAAAFVLCLSPANAVEIQPGLWELTTKVERNGVVSKRRPT